MNDTSSGPSVSGDEVTARATAIGTASPTKADSSSFVPLKSQPLTTAIASSYLSNITNKEDIDRLDAALSLSVLSSSDSKQWHLGSITQPATYNTGETSEPTRTHVAATSFSEDSVKKPVENSFVSSNDCNACQPFLPNSALLSIEETRLTSVHRHLNQDDISSNSLDVLSSKLSSKMQSIQPSTTLPLPHQISVIRSQSTQHTESASSYVVGSSDGHNSVTEMFPIPVPQKIPTRKKHMLKHENNLPPKKRKKQVEFEIAEAKKSEVMNLSTPTYERTPSADSINSWSSVNSTQSNDTDSNGATCSPTTHFTSLVRTSTTVHNIPSNCDKSPINAHVSDSSVKATLPVPVVVERSKSPQAIKPSATEAGRRLSLSRSYSVPGDKIKATHEQMSITPDDDGDVPLHIAATQGNLSAVEKLIPMMERLKCSPDVYNNLRQIPLHLAVITKHLHVVQRLLLAGCNVNLPDRNGLTSLHHAVEEADVWCLKLLFKHTKQPIEVNAKTFNGFAALHLAILKRKPDMVESLLAFGADINIQDGKSGRSPLFHAAETGQEAVVQHLLDKGANINCQNFSGSTALHAASACQRTDLANLLVKHGADTTIKNTNMETHAMLSRDRKAAAQNAAKSSCRKPAKPASIAATPEATPAVQNVARHDQPQHERHDRQPSTRWQQTSAVPVHTSNARPDRGHPLGQPDGRHASLPVTPRLPTPAQQLPYNSGETMSQVQFENQMLMKHFKNTPAAMVQPPISPVVPLTTQSQALPSAQPHLQGRLAVLQPHGSVLSQTSHYPPSPLSSKPALLAHTTSPQTLPVLPTVPSLSHPHAKDKLTPIALPHPNNGLLVPAHTTAMNHYLQPTAGVSAAHISQSEQSSGQSLVYLYHGSEQQVALAALPAPGARGHQLSAAAMEALQLQSKLRLQQVNMEESSIAKSSAAVTDNIPPRSSSSTVTLATDSNEQALDLSNKSCASSRNPSRSNSPATKVLQSPQMDKSALSAFSAVQDSASGHDACRHSQNISSTGCDVGDGRKSFIASTFSEVPYTMSRPVIVNSTGTAKASLTCDILHHQFNVKNETPDIHSTYYQSSVKEEKPDIVGLKASNINSTYCYSTVKEEKPDIHNLESSSANSTVIHHQESAVAKVSRTPVHGATVTDSPPNVRQHIDQRLVQNTQTTDAKTGNYVSVRSSSNDTTCTATVSAGGAAQSKVKLEPTAISKTVEKCKADYDETDFGGELVIDEGQTMEGKVEATVESTDKS